MPSSWLSRRAHLALALILAISAVTLTAPEAVARTAVEADADDDDREAELVAPASARQALSLDRPTVRFALPQRPAPGGETPSGLAFRNAPTDPLGARLRC